MNVVINFCASVFIFIYVFHVLIKIVCIFLLMTFVNTIDDMCCIFVKHVGSLNFFYFLDVAMTSCECGD